MIEEELRTVMRSQSGAPMVFDTCEFARAYLLENFAKQNKHFNKRKHIYEEEGEEQYIEETEVKEVIENLEVKATYTTVTPETFVAWKAAFMAELKANKLKDPKYRAAQAMLLKPSGKKIFEKAKGMEEFFDDDKAEEDDEDVDLKAMMKAGDVEIDEDAFDDEDDLDVDDLSDEEDEDDKKMADLFL